MTQKYRLISTDIWQGQEWRQLPDHAQNLYMAIRTSPALSMCGVVKLHEAEFLPLFPRWTTEKFRDAVAHLERIDLIDLDAQTRECLVVGWITDDGLMSKGNMAVACASAVRRLFSMKIIERIRREVAWLVHECPDWKVWERKGVLDSIFPRPVGTEGSYDFMAIYGPGGPGTHGSEPVGVPPVDNDVPAGESTYEEFQRDPYELIDTKRSPAGRAGIDSRPAVEAPPVPEAAPPQDTPEVEVDETTTAYMLRLLADMREGATGNRPVWTERDRTAMHKFLGTRGHPPIVVKAVLAWVERHERWPFIITTPGRLARYWGALRTQMVDAFVENPGLVATENAGELRERRLRVCGQITLSTPDDDDFPNRRRWFSEVQEAVASGRITADQYRAYSDGNLPWVEFVARECAA